MALSAAASNLVVTANDHGALIVITAALGVTWTVLVLGIRLYIRLRLNGPFGLDDAAASFGTFIGICQTCLTLIAVHFGLGKRRELLPPDEFETAMKTSYAGNFLYILAICCSKCSMSLLMARLTRHTQHRIASHGISCLTIIWAIASLFIVGFQCSPPEPWNLTSNGCSSLFVRWAVVESFSILIEVLISTLAVFLVWDLTMAVRTKVMVVGAFSFQLLVIIPIAFRLSFLDRPVSRDDVTFEMTNSAITTQVVMHLSIMAATFPCFRQFLQAFDSGLGATTKIPTELGTGSHLGSQSQSYALQSIGDSRDDEHAVHRPQHTRLRPDPTAQIVTEATAGRQSQSPGDENGSIESVGSDKAIWKTQKWEVRYETRR